MAGLRPPINNTYPKGKPNPRVDTPKGTPPVAMPSPGPFAGMKTGLPRLPNVHQLFHRPRTAGH